MITKTERGFCVEKFFDSQGTKCSLQESSLATDYAIWFGPKDAEPTLNGVPAEPLINLKRLPDFDDKGNILISTRMHLTEKLTRPIIKCLKIFLKGKNFKAFEFEDLYGYRCSMKITESVVELGIDEPRPQYCYQGWKPLPYPEGTKFTTHMFLSKDLAEQLLPLLQVFVKTGGLSG